MFCIDDRKVTHAQYKLLLHQYSNKETFFLKLKLIHIHCVCLTAFPVQCRIKAAQGLKHVNIAVP